MNRLKILLPTCNGEGTPVAGGKASVWFEEHKGHWGSSAWVTDSRYDKIIIVIEGKGKWGIPIGVKDRSEFELQAGEVGFIPAGEEYFEICEGHMIKIHIMPVKPVK
jgi:mannose-6-phosphate isomerase-like protein (cupin superfamily)